MLGCHQGSFFSPLSDSWPCWLYLISGSIYHLHAGNSQICMASTFPFRLNSKPLWTSVYLILNVTCPKMSPWFFSTKNYESQRCPHLSWQHSILPHAQTNTTEIILDSYLTSHIQTIMKSCWLNLQTYLESVYISLLPPLSLEATEIAPKLVTFHPYTILFLHITRVNL